MHAIYVDSPASDDNRRERLYDGDLFVYSPRPATSALCEFGRQMAEEAFAPLDPETAQEEMEVEAYAALLAELKPRFIHDPVSKRLIQEMLTELGCDPEKAYFDAWSAVRATARRDSDYWPFVDNWSSPAFAHWVASIAGLLDAVTPGGPSAAMRASFDRVVRFEIRFWSAVHTGDAW